MGRVFDFKSFKKGREIDDVTDKAIRILYSRKCIKSLEDLKNLIHGLYFDYLGNCDDQNGINAAVDENYRFSIELLRTGNEMLECSQLIGVPPDKPEGAS